MIFTNNSSFMSGILVAVAFVISAYAATPFSEYGMIQNVQDYSSNPFYNPDTATITTPKIIYATGPSLKAGDCESIVQLLVENECLQRSRCQNTQLSDIRPNIMIKLSTLPGYTYASSCGGYIDTIYEKYVKNNKSTNIINIENVPSNTTTATSKLPKWKEEYNNRANELKALQAQNTTTPTLVATAFPTTFEDLSFSQQKAIKQEVYAPYYNSSPYIPLDIERTENAYVSIPQLIKDDEQAINDCIRSITEKLTQYIERHKAVVNDMRKMEENGTTSSTAYNNLKAEMYRLQCQTSPKQQVEKQNAPCSCSLNHRFRDEYLQGRGIECATDDPSVLSTHPQLVIPGTPGSSRDPCRAYRSASSSGS